MTMWRERGKKWGEGPARGHEARERSRSKEREEGTSSPFYSARTSWPLLVSHREEHTWLMPGNCGGGVQTEYQHLPQCEL